MRKFRIKPNEIVSVPSNEALVRHMNDTAKFPSSSAEEYMKDYAKRSVTDRDIDIRATDFDSFVEDLLKVGDVEILEE